MKEDCESVRSELSAYIDNELPPAERSVIEKHLSGCPRCQRELEGLKTLAAGVTALPRLQPAPQFLAEVRRKLAREGKPEGKVWQDYLFRPFWLKIPLETVAAVVIVALLMRIERPASERALKSEARKDVGQAAAPSLAAGQSQSMERRVPSRTTVGDAVNEASRAPTPSAPAIAAPLTPTMELQQETPAVVVVVHAKDFNDVRNRAQRFAAAMNGRVVPPSSREAAAQTFFVELPPENVTSFKSQLLQATAQAGAMETHVPAGESSPAPKTAPRSAATTGIGPGVLTGKVGTNPVVVGGPERLRAAAEQKAATMILEIQVVPPID